MEFLFIILHFCILKGDSDLKRLWFNMVCEIWRTWGNISLVWNFIVLAKIKSWEERWAGEMPFCFLPCQLTNTHQIGGMEKMRWKRGKEKCSPPALGTSPKAMMWEGEGNDTIWSWMGKGNEKLYQLCHAIHLDHVPLLLPSRPLNRERICWIMKST